MHAVRHGQSMLMRCAHLSANVIAQGREHSERPAGAEGSTTRE